MMDAMADFAKRFTYIVNSITSKYHFGLKLKHLSCLLTGHDILCTYICASSDTHIEVIII